MSWTLRTKYLLAEVLYRLGVLRWLMNRRLRGKTAVLMYHRVLPEATWQESLSSDGIIVTPATFRRHLAWFKQELELLDLDRFRAWLTGHQSLPRPGCLITFDDGWYDNHTYALPLLREAGAPAMICLATDYVGTEHTFWQEEFGQRLRDLARTAKPEGSALLLALGLQGLESLPPETQRQRIISAVRALKGQPWSKVQDLLAQARELAPNIETGPDRFMDWDQAREIHQAGVTLFSHGCSHRVMTSLDAEELESELTVSQQRLKQELGVSTDTLAYPNGNHDDAVVAAAASQGYAIAFTTMPGVVSAGDDRLRLRRINIQDHASRTPAMLACRMLGIF